MVLGDLKAIYIARILNCFNTAVFNPSDSLLILEQIQTLQLTCDELFLYMSKDKSIHTLSALLLYFLRYPYEYEAAESKALLINSKWTDQPIIDPKVKQEVLETAIGL